MIRWSVVSVACYLMALVLAIYAFMIYIYIYISLFFVFLMMFVHDFLHVFCKLLLINYTEGSMISACPSFIAVVHKGIIEMTPEMSRMDTSYDFAIFAACK